MTTVIGHCTGCGFVAYLVTIIKKAGMMLVGKCEDCHKN